jgi:hypothetical protein
LGVFSRPDSPYWWLWLEGVKRKELTHILVNRTGTNTARAAARRAAQRRYFVRMLEVAEDETDVLLARAIALLVRRREDEAKRAEKIESGLGVESSEKGCFPAFSGQDEPDRRP